MTEKEYTSAVHFCANRLYGFCLKLSKDPQQAQDWVQDSFLALWENFSDKNKNLPLAQIKAYLFSTAYRRFIDQYRRLNIHASYVEDSRNQVEIVEENSFSVEENKEFLNEALNRLSEQHRALLLLREIEGYSYEEIEQITDLSKAQVKTYIHRARLALQDILVKKNEQRHIR